MLTINTTHWTGLQLGFFGARGQSPLVLLLAVAGSLHTTYVVLIGHVCAVGQQQQAFVEGAFVYGEHSDGEFAQLDIHRLFFQ